MKCPACGYHNPPDISGCARCGPAAPACAGPEVSETFYPPRARDTSASQRLRERFMPAASEVSVDAEAPAWSVRLHEHLCFAGTVLAALLPGLGQALQGRWRRAAQLAAGCGVLIALFLALLHYAASGGVLGLLFLLVCASVGDVAVQRYPPLRSAESEDERAVLLGWTRIGLFSLGIVLSAVSVGLWALGREYTPWVVMTNWMGTRFQGGDVLLVRHPPRTVRGIRRGQVITYRDEFGPGLERVVALPSDRISVYLGELRVNGVPVAWSSRTPSGGSTFNSRVPGGAIAVSVEDQAGNPVRFVPFAAVRGKVVAILEPAGRRSWVR